MGILKDRFLLCSIIISLGLRLILAFIPGFKIDMDAWAAWAIRLNQIGFANFYSDQVWTNYTPGYLYILWFLGLLKNLFNLSTDNFHLLLKIPPIIAEIALAIFVYKILNKNNWAKISLLVILLNPALIFNSAIWGQIDGLLSLLLLLSIYFLNQKKLIFSAIYFGLAFLIKPQAIALLPVFVWYIFQNKSFRNIIKLFFPASLLIFLLSFPFFTNQIYGLPQLLFKMVSDYSYTSLFAYNFWGIVGFWTADNYLWNNLSYQMWGYVLFTGYWTVITYFFFKKKLSLYSLAALAALSFYFLPTRVHERYLYPAIPFLILAAASLKSRLLFTLTLILSLIHFLNLYYVYVYYNELYFHMPKLLYNPKLYNLLETNGKTLSFISTILFIFITAYILTKSNHVSKNIKP